MGPLVSLLSTSWVREEFLQINRDLTNMFSILGSGEKLLDLTQARQEQLRAVQQELKRCDTFFEEQEEAASRLTSIAAAAKESRCPIRLLHRRLLEQLHEVEDVSALTPDELIDELRYLQLAAMYGTEEEAAEEGAGPLGAPGKKKSKGLDDTLQEFLVQQLCAALAPKAAQSQRTFFPHDAAAAAPDGYLCPISREPMVDPVILEETGFSYEEAEIKRWLETNSSCPASGRRISSKRLIPNINLKKGIQEWAAQNKIRLQAPAPHVPLIVVHPGDHDATPTTSRDHLRYGASGMSLICRVACVGRSSKFRTQVPWAVSLLQFCGAFYNTSRCTGRVVSWWVADSDGLMGDLVSSLC